MLHSFKYFLEKIVLNGANPKKLKVNDFMRGF